MDNLTAPQPAPRLFIVTACLNAAATIRDTVNSVVSQKDLVHRYIVVDGGSTDGTLDILRPLQHQDALGDKLILTSGPDTGIYDAMNRGLLTALEQAEPHDLIGIINADDYYLPGAFETVLAAAAEHPEVGLIYGVSTELDAAGTPTGNTRRSHLPETLKNPAALRTMPVEHSTVFVTAQTYGRVGIFNEDYKLSADYDLILRIIAADTPAHHTRATLTAFRTGGATYQNRQQSLRESVRVRINHGADRSNEWVRYPLEEAWFQAYNAVRGTLAPVLRRTPGASALKRWLHKHTIGRRGRA